MHCTQAHTHNRFTALLDFFRDYLGELLPERYNQEGETNLDSLEQETVSGSSISWAICKLPASQHSVFTGRMPFLPPNQQRESTEGTVVHCTKVKLLLVLSYILLMQLLTENVEHGRHRSLFSNVLRCRAVSMSILCTVYTSVKKKLADRTKEVTNIQV